MQTAPAAALLRGRPTAAENTAEAALPAFDAADSPRSDEKARRKSGFRRANMQSEKNQRCFVEMLNVSE